MSIKDLVKVPDGHVFDMLSEGWDGDAYAFVDKEGKYLGYLWFSVADENMNIDMIEIIDKGQGLGTKAIKFLFNRFDITSMSGMIKSNNIALSFWYSWHPSLEVVYYGDSEYSEDADFEYGYSDYEGILNSGGEVRFIIKKYDHPMLWC
jgi:hypothetical protein